MLLLQTSGPGAVGAGAWKSLSNLRTPKQRNCKILNYKAKETHLIPQELQYVFHWAAPPSWGHSNPPGPSDTVSPPPPGARSQLAPAPLAPVALINTFLYTAERNGEGEAKRRQQGGIGEKISLIHFAYQRIYTLKKLHMLFVSFQC